MEHTSRRKINTAYFSEPQAPPATRVRVRRRLEEVKTPVKKRPRLMMHLGYLAVIVLLIAYILVNAFFMPGAYSHLSVFASIPYWDQDRAFESLRRNSRSIDFVSVFWYHLDPEGNIATYADAKEDSTILNFAKANGQKVLALVANLPDKQGESWDSDIVAQVIEGEEARSDHIDALVALADEKGFDGINIDYEFLEPELRGDFSLFIRDLGEALHSRGKLLGVAIHPKTGENNSTENNGSWAQDWVAIHPYVDHLYFMTYGENSLEDGPGPVATGQWIREVVAYAQEVGVPNEKIFAGLGLYGQEWHEKGDAYEGVNADWTYADIVKIVNKNEGDFSRSMQSMVPIYEYGEEGDRHVIWFEDSESLAKKLHLISKLGVQGVALWRLGGEDSKLWEELGH
ncbi:MAG: glycosyl hydrolase family 18 protein [bacterium]|nr:glycosyl hydrolase family 18 protein [bacterium]